MQRSLLLPPSDIIESVGDLQQEVQNIHFDSRAVGAGDAFVAVKGASTDGHRFIEAAIEKGATLIVCETLPEKRLDSVGYVRVKDSAETLGQMAAAWYGNPSERMKVVGVTGTNGKTTITTLLHQLFTALGYRCGMLGTVENRIGDTVVASTHTTPDSLQLHRLLNEMADAGCQYVFMEVSSHAIHQRRIAGVTFKGAVFSNLTHDHLDYHGTFANYRDAKKRFFDDLPPGAFALVNSDDRNGLVMLQNTRAEKYTYSLRKMAHFKGKILENAIEGLHLTIDDVEIHARMIGEFNAYNLLAAYAAAQLSGMDKMETLTALSDLEPPRGRFQIIRGAGIPAREDVSTARDAGGPAVIIGIVDYAHTPDALKNVLGTINATCRDEQRVITVVGCGGDRDRTKRPIMARIAAEMSHQVVLTSDNPRSEEPGAIIDEMRAGLAAGDLSRVFINADRREAIRMAVGLARPGDVVLVAGKGHETYQEVKGVKHPFDDAAVLKETLELMHK